MIPFDPEDGAMDEWAGEDVGEFEDAGPQEQEGPDLLFRSLDSFVSDYLAVVIQRRLNRATMVWCPEWWQHPEAVARLSALWRAYEYLRLDAFLGLSSWWSEHADPHLRTLLDPDYGPFAMCDPRDGHAERPPEPLPVVPAPPELMAHPAFSLDAPAGEEEDEVDEVLDESEMPRQSVADAYRRKSVPTARPKFGMEMK